MMEHTTDRLFWTLSAIIVGALMLTVGVKIFPKAANAVVAPMQGIVQSADIATGLTQGTTSNSTNSTNDNFNWQVGGNNNAGVSNNSDGTTALAKVNALNNTVTQQQQQMSVYQKSLSEAIQHINDLNSRLVKAQNGGNDTTDQINALQTQINNANAQIQTYQDQINDLNNQLTNNKNQLEAAQTAIQQAVATAAANNDSLVQQLKAQGAQITQQNLALAAYQTQAQQNGQEISNLKQQMQSYAEQGHVSDATIATLQNQITSLQQAQDLANAQSTQAIADAMSKVNDSQSKVDTLTQLVNTLQSQQNSSNSLITNLQTQLNNIQNATNNSVQFIRDLTRNDDANNVKTPGIYGLKDSNANGTPANMPSFATNNWGSINGQMVVNHVQTQFNDTYYQTIYYTQDGNNQAGIAYRSFHDGAWTNWQQVANANQINGLQNQINIMNQSAGLKYLGTLDNISSYKNVSLASPGWYDVNGNISDLPEGTSTKGRLYVVADTSNGGNLFYITNKSNNSTLYQGSWTTSGFGDFKKIANSDDITQLQNQIATEATNAANQVFKSNMYDLPAASDLNNTYTNSYFWPGTANQPNFGFENGPVLYAGTTYNGVQYAFASGGASSKGFAWRSQSQGNWTAWHYGASQDDIQNLQNQINNLQSQLNNTPVIRNSLKSYGTDFNNFTGTGIYPMDGAWATDWQNGPNYDDNNGPSYGRPGGVQLQITNADGNITQTVTATNSVWQRYRFNGVWTAWTRTDASNALQYQGGLDSNKSFNDYDTTGIWSLDTKQPPRDAPDGNWIGTLEVIKAGSTTVQKWYSFENSGGVGTGWKVREYMRDREAGQSWWNSWVEVATVDEAQQAINAANNAQNTANNAQNTANSALQQAQQAINTTGGLSSKGEWNSDFYNWGAHSDGIYSINTGPGQNGLPANFSGWGVATLVTNNNGADRYLKLVDNVDHVFYNHQFVGSGGFSGWTQMATSDDINNVQNAANNAQNTANWAGGVANNAQNAANNAQNTANSANWRANNSLYIGDTLGNNTRLRNIQNSGVYALNGAWYLGLPGGRDGNMWGQLVVYNGGGVVNQILYDNQGQIWRRSINSWGTTSWDQV